jgi:hypothetical protein
VNRGNDVRNLDPYDALRAHKEQSLSAVEDEGGVPTASQNGESVNDRKMVKNVDPQKTVEEQKPHDFSAVANEGGLRLSRLPQRTLRTAEGHGGSVLTSRGRDQRNLAAVAHEGGRRYHAGLLRYVMNRVALALAIVAMLPILACRHVTIVQAQNDPLNNSYKPSVDCNPADYPSNIALSGPMVKLRQDSGSPSGVAGAAPCITVMATQNEFQGFQVHVQAPSGGYTALSVTMSALTKSNGPGNTFTIPAPSTSNNNIVVYREGYINVTTVTAKYATYFGTTGHYPDPLIPAIDPYYHQTTAAFPVSVAAGQNQSAWVDVYIPQNAASGWYSGTVTISNGGATITTLPVIYGVWQWPTNDGGYMPSTATLKSNMQDEGSGNISWYGDQFYTSGTLSSYPGGLQGAEQDQAIFFLDHRLTIARFSCIPYANSNCGDGSGYSIANYYGRLENGTDPTYLTGINRIMPGSKLGGNDGQGPGGMCTGSDYGAPGAGSACQTKIASFESNWKANGWLSSPPNGWEDYIMDEPGSSCSSLSALVTEAGYTRGYSTPNIPILLTAKIGSASACSSPSETQFENAVDIFVVNDVCMDPIAYACSFGSPAKGNQRSTYDAWMSGNCCGGSGPARQVWGYESNSSDGGTYPNYHVDGLGVANAAQGWEAFVDRESGILYYAIHILWGANDPWSSVLYEGGNGDGTLLYACSNSSLISGKGSASCGVAGGTSAKPIFVPSIRLQLMRDGIQDYEYLNLLNSLGGPYATAAQNAVSSWYHGGYCFNLNPVSPATDPCGNSSTGDITDARIQLGNAMHQITYPVTVLPPATVTPTLQP